MSGEKTHQSVVNLIDTFLEKAAADEKAASNLDLAGDAKSTHPSANVDDKTKPATEGSRSSENEADVKKEVPDTINDSSSENTDGKGNEGATVNGDQGTVTMDADSGLQGNVDKPKKDHSQSMSDAGPGDGGESFKGDWDKASAAGSLTADANGILADLTLLIQGADKQAEVEIEIETEKEGDEEEEEEEEEEKEASDKSAKKADGEKQAADENGEDIVELYKQAAAQFPEDVEAGYAAAALLAQHIGLIKGASTDDTQIGANAVEMIQKEAAADAQMLADYLNGFAESTKEAQGLDDPAALAALGNAGEGEAAGGEMGGGEDIGAMLAGAGGGEGGMPGAEMMGGEGMEGGGDEEAIIEALAQALDEAGVTPEDLAEAVASEGGAEGGEMEAEEGAEVAPEGGGEEVVAEEGAEEKMSSAQGSSVKALADKLVQALAKK